MFNSLEYEVWIPRSSQDEKEQLTEFKTHLEGLKRRAKTVIQLKPRNPASAIKGKQPIQAVCDFKQMEVSVQLLAHFSYSETVSLLSVIIRKSQGCPVDSDTIVYVYPPDHRPQRRRVRPVEQLTALQVEGAERQRQRGVRAFHLLPGSTHQ